MSEEVAKWLEGLTLGQYADAFEENDIGWSTLTELNHDLLKEAGIKSIGHRVTILKAIESLGSDSDSAPAQRAESDTIELTKSAATGEAERRQLTVMFCDLAGSTELSQRLDPEDLREVNRAYQDACKAAIERYEGYVARYMGDGVLAYFGYPQAHEDDAERAIHAGLGVVDSVTDLTVPDGSGQEEKLSVRVGIATGQVVVGDLIGEGASQESAVVGETPNLAARLQGIATGNAVVISSGTHGLVGERFKYDDLDEHLLKGIAEPVHAWRVIAAVTLESRFDFRHRAELTPLVGREQEIGLLLDRWSQAKDGDGQVVLLSGEAGIGKSRVTETLRERIAVDAPALLRYQCSPFHTNTALHPVIEQLQRAAGIDADDPNEVKLDKFESVLSQNPVDSRVAVPLLAALLSIPIEDRYEPLDLSPERQKEQTLETLLTQMERLSQRQPVLFIFEDAHWADPTSLELLELTIGRAQSVPVLIVLTHRPEFSPSWGNYTHVTSLTLNRFTRGLASTMVENVTGGKSLPDEVLERVIERTDGVPLFVEEFTATILESGFLTEEADRYVANGPIREIAIPTTLHDSLMARLDRLGAVKEVAQTASAIGREFDHNLLGAVSSLSLGKLRDALNQLIDAGIIFRRGRPGGSGYIFKHALVQDAAYESLLRKHRQTLHERIANKLVESFDETIETQPELVAHHYTEANLVEPAVRYWLRGESLPQERRGLGEGIRFTITLDTPPETSRCPAAGKRATEHCTYVEAIAHLNRGLELVGHLPDAKSRGETEITLRLVLGVLLCSMKGWASPESEHNYSRAYALCEEFEQSEQLFPILWGLWIGLMMRSSAREACALADRLLEVGDSSEETGLRLQAHHCQWTSRFILGELGSVMEHTQIGMELYEPERHHELTYTYGGHDAGVCARQIGSLALWLSGYPEQSLVRLQDAFELARELGHLNTLVEAQCCIPRSFVTDFSVYS